MKLMATDHDGWKETWQMLKAAIVGMGSWGQTLVRSVHGKSDKIAVTRGVNRTVANAAAFSEETGIPVVGDYEAVLADAAIDAVILATPHSQHVAQIVAAAKAGKHVMCEKPLTLAAEDVRTAYAACRDNNVVLAVAQNRRFLPAVVKLKTMIDSGELGKIMHFDANFSGGSGYRFQQSPNSWRANDVESPAGSMTGRGLHMTDLMIHLGGLADDVVAFTQRRILDIPLDDTVALMLKFKAGCSGYLASMATTGEIWRFGVYGSKGWAEIREHETLATRPVGGKESIEVFAPFDIERAELEAFADAVAGGAAFPVTEDEAVNNIAILQAILASAEAGAVVETGTF